MVPQPKTAKNRCHVDLMADDRPSVQTEADRLTVAALGAARDSYQDPGSLCAMRTTIDKAGRLVLPKPLRDRVGLQPGEVEVFADGAGLRVEAIAGDDLEERDGRLVVPSSGGAVNDEVIRALRDADQR